MLNQFSDLTHKPVGTFPPDSIVLTDSNFVLQKRTWEALGGSWLEVQDEFGSLAAELPEPTINEVIANVEAQAVLMEELKGL